jgi:HPt (histidine-containing phosphotransfer) domain-containing protein
LDSAKPGSQAIRIAGASGQETRCAGSRSDKDSSLPQSLPAPQSGWEIAELLNRLDGDEDLIREPLALFQEDSPKELLKAKQCLAEEDWQGLSRAAHTIRGSLRYLSMNAPARIAEELETVARNGQRQESVELLTRLDGALQQMLSELEARLIEVK